MTSHLRPLSLGEILDRTAELYRNHFLLFAGIAAIFSGAMLFIQMLHLGLLEILGLRTISPQLTWGTSAVAVVETLALLMLAGLGVAANNRAVAWVNLGEMATIRGAANSILPRMRRYLWLMFITWFRAWAPLSAVYVALFAIMATVLPGGFMANPGAVSAAPVQDPAAFLRFGLFMLVLAPLFLATLIYGILMALRYALAMPACVVEGLSAGAALKRSVELSKGARGRVFVLGLLVGAVRLILGIVLGFPFIAFTFKHPGHSLPIGLMAMQQLAAFVVNTLIGPIYATGLTLFYYDQRIRKEGYDIEWMMQAAGLTPQAELPAPEEA
jgi:hypothetical protein